MSPLSFQLRVPLADLTHMILDANE